jgi:hypothetical protein
MAPKTHGTKAAIEDLLAFVDADGQDPEPVMKRLASKSPGGQAAMKRPASSVMLRPAAATTFAITPAEDAEETTRNRMKGYYFNELLKKGDIPEHLEEAFKSAKRKTKTELVNKCMKPGANTTFGLNPEAPMMQETKTKFEKRFFTDTSIGLPRTLAAAKFFNKDMKSLDQAVLNGEMKEVEVDGAKFYSWREIRVGRESGASSSTTIQKTTGIEDRTYAELSGLLDGLGWQFNFNKKEEKAPSDQQPSFFHRP